MRTRSIILATLVALICFTSAPAQTLGSILQQKPAHLSLSGPALVLAAGITQQSTSLNFPINLAVVIAKGGPRIALLVGFSKRD